MSNKPSLFILTLIFVLSGATGDFARASGNDNSVYPPASYLTFQPPAKGGSYTDAVFGTAIRRLTDSMTMTRADIGSGTLGSITPEYSTMSPFNKDNTRLLLEHFAYFGLYDGSGNYLRDLLDISASSEPRWSRSDPNVIYFIRGNQLKTYNVGTSAITTVHIFSEYSTISGGGESDISEDGNHFAFAGDHRYIFVYDVANDSKSATLDTTGHSWDSLYMTPNNNVTITWLTLGAGRYQGIELFDGNMSFQRQVAKSGGHMDVSRDTNGDEILLWTNSNDPTPIACNNGIVKIRLADAHQTCLVELDWSLAVHVSAPDNSGWVFVETYNPIDIAPPTGWKPYTNEFLQVKLDGTEVRRLAHHRSRPLNGYTYMPKISTSRDGSKLVFGSNFGLQAQIGDPTEYSDVYMIDLGNAAPASTTPAATTTPAPTTTPPVTSAVIRSEQTASSVVYSGSWLTNSNSVHSGGSATQAMDAGSRATFTFSGTGANWIGYSDEWSGIANITVDGVAKGEIDSYRTPQKAQATQYSITGLPDANHTLTIETTGRRNTASGGGWVWVDAFEALLGGTTPTPVAAPPVTVAPTAAPAPTPAPATAPTPAPTPAPASAPPVSSGTAYHVEQTAKMVRFSGNWFVNNNASQSGGSAKLAMDAGAKATFTFTGDSVSWVGYRDMWSGVARITLDGSLKGELDTYSPTNVARTKIYTANGLVWGTHTLVVEATGKHSSLAKGSWVWVDAFDYSGTVPSALTSDLETTTAAVIAGGSSATSSGSQALKVGYAQVAGAANAPAGLAIFGYRQNGVLVSEAGVPASGLIQQGRIAAEVEGNVNTGFALVNPNESVATIGFYFTDGSGVQSSSGTMTVPPRSQISKFLNEVPFNAAPSTNGTFTFNSDIPVSAIALRGYTNERGEFLVTTLPITDTNQHIAATMYFPHLATGGGWVTEFSLVNPSDSVISGTLDFTTSIEIDGQPRNTVAYSIAPRASVRYMTTGTYSSVQVGSARVHPAEGNPAPDGLAVFSFTHRGVRVSEAGVPLQQQGNAFRMYAEASSSIQTGVAVLNTGDADEQVTFELANLDGSSTGLQGSVTLAAGGQRALFLNEVPGFSSLALPFKGVLRLSTADAGDIVVLGLRGRWNERNDFLITTTPPANEAELPRTSILFPHIVDGGGYTTQFILFSGTAAESATGNLQIFSQTGSGFGLTLN